MTPLNYLDRMVYQSVRLCCGNGPKRGTEGQNRDHGEFELETFHRMLQPIVWSHLPLFSSSQHPPWHHEESPKALIEYKSTQTW
jgi:hypothetical protein